MRAQMYTCLGWVVMYRGSAKVGDWKFSKAVPGIFNRRKDAAAAISTDRLPRIYKIVRIQYEVPR